MTYVIDDILEVLSESTLDGFLNTYNFAVITEGEKSEKFKNAIKATADVGKKVVDKATKSKVGAVMGNAYNKATEAPGGLIARTLYGKRPVDVPVEVQKEYDKKVINVKANIKAGVTVAVLIAKSLLVGPPDWIITICMVSGLMTDSEVNSATKEKIKNIKNTAVDIKNKIKSLATKYKDCDSTDREFQKEYNELLREGNKCAREADAIIKQTKTSRKQVAVTESSIIKKFDDYLITETGSLVHNATDILHSIINKVDYDKYDIYPIIERYCDMMY